MKNKFLKVILPIIVLIVMAGCSGIRVSTDYDRKVDFSKYRTFNFSKEVDKVSLNDLNRRRLKDAITHEMNLRGYQVSETPDVLVNAFVKGRTKYSAMANTNYMGGWYYRGMGFSNTYVDACKVQIKTAEQMSQYIEGIRNTISPKKNPSDIDQSKCE